MAIDVVAGALILLQVQRQSSMMGAWHSSEVRIIDANNVDDLHT